MYTLGYRLGVHIYPLNDYYFKRACRLHGAQIWPSNVVRRVTSSTEHILSSDELRTNTLHTHTRTCWKSGNNGNGNGFRRKFDEHCRAFLLLFLSAGQDKSFRVSLCFVSFGFIPYRFAPSCPISSYPVPTRPIRAASPGECAFVAIHEIAHLSTLSGVKYQFNRALLISSRGESDS